MRDFNRQTSSQASSWTLILGVLVVLSSFMPWVSAEAQTPVDAGYRDLSYGTTGSSTPTGKSTESKLWQNDGRWWADLYNVAAGNHHIYWLDTATHTWVDTGTVLDTRKSTKSDLLWDQAASKLYLATHAFTENPVPSATQADWGRLFRYSYDAVTKTYSLDTGFPVFITRGKEEVLTLAKDSTGVLWVTYMEKPDPLATTGRVMVNHSIGTDELWGTPFALPVDPIAATTSADDISATIAFGGNKIGVLWSNQATNTFYFSVHLDADADTTWQAPETIYAGTAGAADDHISVKTDSSGRLYAALKTNLQTAADPLVLLAVRNPSTAGWSTFVVGTKGEHHTRQTLMIDETNNRVHIFMANPEVGGAIYSKSADLINMSFPAGQGTPVLKSATDPDINDVTSSKQNVTNVTGLVVLAGDSTTKFYFHNEISISLPPLPTITSFTPTSGGSGTVVTITGANFGAVTGVSFNGTAATFTLDSDTQITATAPAGATTGKIGVTNAAGTALSATDFSLGGTSVSSFTPVSGKSGTTVTVNGSKFTGTTKVTFNGASASSLSIVVLSDTQLTAKVPSTGTTGKICVTSPSGVGCSATDFLVYVSPKITSFSPASGPIGTEVTIVGSGFIGTTKVRFNLTTAPVFTVDSNTQLRATVPTGATTGKIRVTNPAGTVTSSTNFTIATVPTISSFTPASDIVGASVTLTGTGFTGATAVTFNSTAATSFTVNSSTQITATVPVGATTGKISVTTALGTGASATDFTVIVAPTITTFSPASGAVGTSVTLTGTGFSGTTAVAFNGTAATTFTVDSNTQIHATVPTGATTGKISVTNPAGTVLSATNFTVANVPIISSFAPASGIIGASITITGTNFTGATAVTFNGTPATFTVDLATQITATVPLGATTGKINVTNPEGTGTSATDFTVIVAPTITTFSPASGSAGTPVTITGTGFSGTTAVAFNGTAATFTVNSATQITATVPVGATAGKISVTNPAGSALSATDFTISIPQTVTFTAAADAQVKSSSPTANYGSLTALQTREATDGTPVYRSYIRFTVSGLGGTVTAAKLRLFVTDESRNGTNVFTVVGPWDEATITWATAPTAGALQGSAGASVLGTFYEITLPASLFAGGNGTYDLLVFNTSTDSAIFSSREGANPPQLVLTQN